MSDEFFLKKLNLEHTTLVIVWKLRNKYNKAWKI